MGNVKIQGLEIERKYYYSGLKMVLNERKSFEVSQMLSI